MTPAQTAEKPTKENFFDERGENVPDAGDTHLEADPIADEAREAAGDADGDAAPAPEVPKFKIGDRSFTTSEEALAYANSQVEVDQQVANAYQQGMRDAIGTRPSDPQSVTPPPPKLNTEELYSNPEAFLEKYGNSIKEQVLTTVHQQRSVQEQSDSIWREFCNRHPSLADFRAEVEGFVGQNTKDVRGIIQTKGRDASYDYIATKLRSRFENYASALKPARELPNTRTASAPTPRAAGVTPKADPKKPLSMIEQIRSIKKGR